MKRNILFFFFTAFAFSITQAQIPNDSTLESVLNFSIEELMNTKVSIATKSAQSLSEAPSIVTVITSEVIKNSGARNLVDILQYIPGFEFSKPRVGIYAIGVRGVKDLLTTSRFLILKDGIPYNDIMYGSGFANSKQFDINSIERIEIIRGPGSALYGRNAFIGVINIITKSAKKKNDGEAYASYGNFNTLDFGASYGTQIKDLSGIISFEKVKTDNTDSELASGMGGKSIWNIGHDDIFVNSKLNYKDLMLTASYSDIINGTSAGPFATQSDKSTKIGLYSLEYTTLINKLITLNSKIYGRNEFQTQHVEIATPLTTDEAAPGIPYNSVYPNGIYATPKFNAYTYGFDANLDLSIIPKNQTLFGLQTDFYGIQDVELYSSYDTRTSAPLTYTIDGVTYYRGKDTQIKDDRGWIEGDGHHYQNIAFYLQNIYSPFNNFSITLGGRYDIDSEFGGIFNPRLGFVWKTNQKLTFKLLYGQAYRAPNSQEQYRNTGFTIGNKDLKPETIKTTEFSVNYNLGKNINNRLTLFYNVLDDMIYAQGITSGKPGSPYSNIGENRSKGFEYEYRMLLTQSFYMYFNYSYTFSENNVNHNDTIETFSARDIAPHKINLGVNYKFLKHFNINTNLMYRSQREKYFAVSKQTGNYILDTYGNKSLVSQDELGNYFILNAKLRVIDFYKNFEIALETYNLLNTKYYDQDTEYAHQPAREGRQLILVLGYKF